MNPNWLATFALALWPAVAVLLYQTRPLGRATIWTILGAQLVLPVDVFLKLAQGIPQLDKVSIPNLAALLGCILYARPRLRLWKGLGLAEALLLMYVIGPFITSELNGDPVRFGPLTLPAVGHYDALSAAVAELIFLLPFFLARDILTRASDNEDILRALVIAGLCYSLPMLFEIRMSPQLNLWIYGYYPSDFVQAVRGGGFRPMVFMGHGLAVAFFTMTTVVAAAALWRIRVRILQLSGTIAAYLGAVLILCKSFGPLVYAAVLVPLVRWTSPGIQLRVATCLVMLVLSYPLLRAADLVPTTSILDVANSIDKARAASLKFRFDNEERLLKRASERLWFGWGRFGRGRYYDVQTGRDLSTTDGEWIIRLGTFGLFGFAAEFGLLALSVFRAAAALRYASSMREGILMSALALIVTVYLINMIPNASFNPWVWLISGALLGRSENMRAAAHHYRLAQFKIGTASASHGLGTRRIGIRSRPQGE